MSNNSEETNDNLTLEYEEYMRIRNGQEECSQNKRVESKFMYIYL